MRRSIPALFTALPAAALLLALAQAPARADSCTITGPGAWCGSGTVELCGPTGDWAYEWSGPDGFSSGDRCVNVSTPGHYTLVAYNPWMGTMLDPCSYDLAVATPPVASIDGASSTCAGTSARLCGPFGNFSWLWTAPDGSQATTQCVDAAQAGTWTLAVTDMVSGCSGDPALHALAFTVCDTTPTPPPTPPPGDPVVCPRNVNFWAQQCRGNGRHNGNMLDDDAFARLAACVDAHATVFDWSNPVAGLCSTLNFRSAVDLRSRTLRQFAAVVANVCAGNLGLDVTSGAPLGLDPSTPLTMEGQASTIGAWVIDADARLTALEGRNGRSRDRDAAGTYRSILRSAWNINHGVGLGVKVCDAAMRSGGMGDDADGAGDERDLTIGLGAAGPSLSIAAPAPNPFRAGTRVEFTVDADADQNVVVTVHDLSGRVVRELARGSWSPGTHALDWNGTDASGHRVPAGIYFVQGSIGGQRVQSRVTMLH